MKISRSTYYFEIKKSDVVAERNKDLLDEIKDIFTQNKSRNGVRRVYQELIHRGHTVNYKRVQWLMHEAGPLGKRPKKKYHSYISEVGRVVENLIHRDSSTTAPSRSGQPTCLSLIFRGEIAIFLPS